MVPRASSIDYKKEVEPILRLTCYECHGSKEKGKLRMDRLERFSERIGEGTYREDKFVIYPGHPEKSELIYKITLPVDHDDRMPPPGRGKDPLTARQVATLKDWIRAGASFEEGDIPVPPVMPDKEALQTFTGASGQTLEAYFVKLDGEQVVLRSTDGKEKAFDLKLFSEESVALMKQLSGL